ncbi:MAG: LPS assembly protein LptD [Rhodospirillaceae bacterium]|nr:LPS assembly protein LptD [Rhodospirillaceae bacterium]
MMFKTGSTLPRAQRTLPLLVALGGVLLCALLYAVPHALAQGAEGQTLILAEEMRFDEDSNTVTATGNVEIERDGRILIADQVTYNQETDVVAASGNVTLVDSNGSVLFFETAEIDGELKTGFAREVQVLLADDSRMAARLIRRRDGNINELRQVVYTACDLNCDGDPVWQIKARKIIHDQDNKLMTYNDAWVEVLGLPVFYTPYLAHPDPTADRQSGLLAPAIGGGSNLGFSYAQPYYWNIAPDRDATLTPLYTSSAGRGAIGEYRQLFPEGELSLFGSLVVDDDDNPKDFRGHVRAKARWDIDERWRTGADVYLASDDTYLRRYDFDAPTWLTTNAFVERFGTQSYFSANAYHFQRQRRTVATGSTPLIAPLIDYSFVGKPIRGGGYFTANASALALYREDGSDQTRLSTTVGWHVPYISESGSMYTLRATLRGDGYYVRDVIDPTNNTSFTGFEGRAIPQVSMEWRYPLVRTGSTLTQQLEPIVQGIISPNGSNPSNIPNEDSRDFEFDDTNLFSEQRFYGYDRVEGGARVNYGLRWSAYGNSGKSVDVMVGQSYRFKRDATFALNSGLDGHFSDYVGHVTVRPTSHLDLSYRFRLDQSDFSTERSEFSASIGNPMFRLGANYIFIKPSNPAIPEFGDREELYAFFDTRLSKHWSLTGSHRENLGLSGGSIRSSIGIEYEDECFVFGLDVTDDNTEDRDFQSGFSVILRFTLKTIGEVRLSSSVGVDQ